MCRLVRNANIACCSPCRCCEVESLSSLRHHMAAATDLQTCAPFSRWDIERLYHPAGGSGRTASRFATYVDSTYAFDAAAFGVAAAEAALMDPQQRLLLEETLAAFQSAGHRPQAGCLTCDCVRILRYPWRVLPQSITGSRSVQCVRDREASSGHSCALLTDKALCRAWLAPLWACSSGASGRSSARCCRGTAPAARSPSPATA